MKTRIKCPCCGLFLASQYCLKVHARTYHKDYHRTILSNSNDRKYTHSFVCRVCDSESAKFKRRIDFLDHLTQTHGCDVETINLRFSSSEQFRAWKDQYEAEDRNRFSVVTHCKAYNKTLFRCQRSGFFKSRGKGVRRLKKVGSKKINGYCPAQIKLVQRADGELDVAITRTHWGHDDEIAHCSLSTKERQFLAERIASNIPFSDILHEIRTSANETGELKRLHLVTTKDLHNISNEFDLKSLKNSLQMGDFESIDDDLASISENRDDLVVEEGGCSSFEEADVIVGQPCREDSSDDGDSLQETRSRLLLTISALVEEVKHMNSFKDLEMVEDLLDPIESMLGALREERIARSNFGSNRSKFGKTTR